MPMTAATSRSAKGARSALEARVTDHLSGRLQIATELVELDVGRSAELDLRQDVGRLDARRQGILEGLIAEVALRLVVQQEPDQLLGFVLAVAALQHRCPGDDHQAA